jgi:hypothetical protein
MHWHCAKRAGKPQMPSNTGSIIPGLPPIAHVSTSPRLPAAQSSLIQTFPKPGTDAVQRRSAANYRSRSFGAWDP